MYFTESNAIDLVSSAKNGNFRTLLARNYRFESKLISCFISIDISIGRAWIFMGQHPRMQDSCGVFFRFAWTYRNIVKKYTTKNICVFCYLHKICRNFFQLLLIPGYKRSSMPNDPKTSEIRGWNWDFFQLPNSNFSSGKSFFKLKDVLKTAKTHFFGEETLATVSTAEWKLQLSNFVQLLGPILSSVADYFIGSQLYHTIAVYLILST